MKITGDQHYVKKMNKSIVLETIMQSYPISRAQVSESTGLNKATVSSLVQDLLDEHMIYELGPGHATRGRKPVMLLFDKTAGYAIGIDIGVHYVLSVLTDLEGNKVEETYTQHDNTDANMAMDIIKKHIDHLRSQVEDAYYGIIGIGIAVPGIIDHHGQILLAPNLGWKNMHLKQSIEDHFNMPVQVINEANSGALGEKSYGAGQKHSSLIYISAGIGIGVGIILNDHLYTGKNGYAGEFGHTTIKSNGKTCSCGSSGCWELYASEKALIHLLEANSKTKFSTNTSIEEILQHSTNQQEHVMPAFRQIGYYLGIGVANLINAFNPEAIIIGNNLAKARDLLDTSLRQVLTTHALPFHRGDIEISYAQLGSYSNAQGSAAVAISSFLSNHYLTDHETMWEV
jgi:glucokinase-like ROK family protein